MSEAFLPPELEYVREFALACNGHASTSALDAFASELSDVERIRWEEVKNCLDDSGHRPLLRSVIQKTLDTRFAVLLVRFLSVCDRLDPDYDPDELPTPPSEEEAGTPDWSQLPKGMEYLRGPAARYGVYLSEVTLDMMIDHLDDDSLRELEEVAIRMKQDRDILNDWFEKRRDEYTTSRELQMVSSLITVLDLLGHYR